MIKHTAMKLLAAGGTRAEKAQPNHGPLRRVVLNRLVMPPNFNPTNTMKLQKLEIELERWGVDKGQYKAKISYADQTGTIELLLDNDTATDLLAHTGDAIRKFSSRAADSLRESVDQSVQEARALPAITA